MDIDEPSSNSNSEHKKKIKIKKKVTPKKVQDENMNDTSTTNTTKNSAEKKKKREIDEDESFPSKNKNSSGKNENDTNDMLPDEVFEDPYEDEFEEEDVIDNEMDVDEENANIRPDDDEENEYNPKANIFLPGKKSLAEDEVLDYDASAYDMLHMLTVDWPCLSFDIVPDNLGAYRTKFPHTVYFVAGTQTDEIHKVQNKLYVMKASRLSKTKYDEDSENDESDDEVDVDPVLEHKTITHRGGINRVKVMPQAPHLVATWSEEAVLGLWDVSKHLESLDVPGVLAKDIKPLASLSCKAEGFAVAWSPHKPGRLIAGDTASHIYFAEPTENLTGWTPDPKPFLGHTSSVEDLQWSPTESEVFVSCSADKTVKIWDTRAKKPQRSWIAADSDVNVVSWNKKIGYLLVTGADDGSFKIWDLRALKSDNNCQSVAHFKWHKDQITSVEWDPNDESVIGVAGADDQVTLWDLSVEKDPEELNDPTLKDDLPAQLLFVHMGQTDVKELHFHPQIPSTVITTAENGINIFKPSVTEE